MSKANGFSTEFESFDSSFNQKAAGYLNLELGTTSVGNIKFKSSSDWIDLSGSQRGDSYFLSGGGVSLEVTPQIYLAGGFSGSIIYNGQALFLNAWAAEG
ncbi:MAG: hypothetical protein AAGN66_14725 [Acidobacteriota bacterium]